MKYHYTPEQIQWIKENCHGLTWREAWQLTIIHFGLKISYSQFQDILRYRRIKLGRLCLWRKYPPEHFQWIMENCRGLTGAEAVRLFNAHFRLKISYSQFSKLIARRKIRLGLTGKNYGGRSKPVGTVILIKQNDGYEELRVKTAIGKNKKNWVSLNQFLRLKELKRALRAKLKKTDNRVYRKRYVQGGKRYRLNDEKLLNNLLGGGTVRE